MPDNAATANGAASAASLDDFGPHVHVSSHPVLSHKITIMRSCKIFLTFDLAVMRQRHRTLITRLPLTLRSGHLAWNLSCRTERGHLPPRL